MNDETVGLPPSYAAMLERSMDVPDWFLLAGWDRIPRGWMRRAMPLFPYRYVELAGGDDRLLVIITGRVEADERRWIHVSCSRPNRLPDWYDLLKVKEAFIGGDRVALQVLPRRDQHVNIAPHCAHLWHCIDADVVPDFRDKGMI